MIKLVQSEMLPSIIGFNDMDQSRGMASNLELVTLYTYQGQFALKLNDSISRVRTNLIIDRQTAKIRQVDREQPIARGYISKQRETAFMGLLTIMSQTYLFLVHTCEKVCTIEGLDIFEVKEISLVRCGEQAIGQLKTQIDNYAQYLKNYLLKQGYYFSYEYDLSLSRQAFAKGYPTRGSFFWNLNMGQQLLQMQDKGWFIGMMQGSIKHFKVFLQGKKVEFYLITRRNWKLGGTRYNARGIDNKGHPANFCQSEQLIVVGGHMFSHVQIRGSVPAFWKQSGIYAQVQFYGTHENNRIAFTRHFLELNKIYGDIFCLNLLSKTKSGQKSLTLYYEQLIKQIDLPYVRYEFYDFHFACKGQKFERSDYLIEKVAPVNNYFSYYCENMSDGKVISQQKGVFRTNCLDCLDRTNLVQSKIAYEILGVVLVKCGFDMQSIIGKATIMKAARSVQSSNMFVMNLKNAWADNGDIISKHYTGTGSTHTNVTRTGRRDLKGVMDHGLKSLSRFYKQYMEDNYKQEAIDILVGQHTPTINLSQFQSRLKNVKEEDYQTPELVQF